MYREAAERERDAARRAEAAARGASRRDAWRYLKQADRHWREHRRLLHLAEHS
jgi:hypothetical protein